MVIPSSSSNWHGTIITITSTSVVIVIVVIVIRLLKLLLCKRIVTDVTWIVHIIVVIDIVIVPLSGIVVLVRCILVMKLLRL